MRRTVRLVSYGIGNAPTAPAAERSGSVELSSAGSRSKTSQATRASAMRPVASAPQQWNTPAAASSAAMRHITSAHSLASDGEATMLMSSASQTANGRPTSSASTMEVTK